MTHIIEWEYFPQYGLQPASPYLHRFEPPVQKWGVGRCVRWMYSPENVEELLRIENLATLLCSNFVFIHNKKPLINELLDKLSAALPIEVLSYRDIELTYEAYVVGEWLSRKKTEYQTVLLFEATGQKMRRFIEQFIDNGACQKQCGIWFCGYIDELQDFIPSFFDALFIFDTSMYEFDILRRRMAISEVTIKALRSQQLNSPCGENTLFYWNYQKKPNAPLLDANPKILSLNGSFRFAESDEVLELTQIFLTQGAIMSKYNFQNISQSPIGHIGDVSGNEIINQESKSSELFDFSCLADELARLSQEMQKDKSTTEIREAAKDVADAEKAARVQDAPKVMQYLKSAGKWALDIAMKIGVPIAVKAIEHALSMP